MTVYDSSNFGSYLQAYALKKSIENLGHDVKFIKFRDKKELEKLFFGNKRNLKSFIRNYSFNKEKYKIFFNDVNKYKVIGIDDITQETFDVLIIGSDELWNVQTKGFTREFFYGIDIPIKRKVAFAISSGKAITSDYQKYPNLIEAIKELDEIYVRDERTKINIKELIGKDCEVVCDPTFLINVEELDKKYNITIDKKYLLVYSYNFSKEQQECIKRFAREKDLIIVSVCFKHKFCDRNINCSPLEFCKIIQNSEYVITTTFHGTIFSVLNKKQFISMPSGQKVTDVLKKLKLENQIIENEKNYQYNIFKNKLENKIDFSIPEREILTMRKKSIKILESILNCRKYKE